MAKKTKLSNLKGKMKNVDISVTDDELVITVDLKGKRWPSSSGKTTMIATTGGNVEVTDGVIVGLNVYTPA